MLVQATEENNDTTAAWAVLRYQRVQEVPWLWATSWLNSAKEQRHHQLRLFPAKNILNTAGPSISDSRNSLWGLKTAHLWANFSESNTFLLPWRSVIIEGVIYNGGVWISAPSLQRPEQPGRLPNNRPAATTGHSEERRKFEPARNAGEQWVLGWKGHLFQVTFMILMSVHLWSVTRQIQKINKQKQKLSGPRLPVHSSSRSQYNQFFLLSPDGVAPVWCVQDNDKTWKCQRCNSIWMISLLLLVCILKTTLQIQSTTKSPKLVLKQSIQIILVLLLI